ncbi:hypothetical protein MUK42_15083 [Musa troglodytarum]|uniref:Uncharacterized protein n=1 Tax=Musa troglodytarum TaxID=320322 RepID=A0A9E7I6U9_9LILI|nr:hypothetical protein MUK42_15083 [Musa troglodytarum]
MTAPPWRIKVHVITAFSSCGIYLWTSSSSQSVARSPGLKLAVHEASLERVALPWAPKRDLFGVHRRIGYLSEPLGFLPERSVVVTQLFLVIPRTSLKFRAPHFVARCVC